MTKLAQHRNWLILLTLALLIASAGHPALRMATEAAEQKAAQAKVERVKYESGLRQLKADREAVRELSQKLSPESVERILAPADRLKAGTALEQIAAASRLKNIAYTFSPEQPVAIDAAGSGKLALAQSGLTWEASAPLDKNIRAFIDHLQTALPGKLSLERLSIARTGTAISATPLRAEASMIWLSNGTAP